MVAPYNFGEVVRSSGRRWHRQTSGHRVLTPVVAFILLVLLVLFATFKRINDRILIGMGIMAICLAIWKYW